MMVRLISSHRHYWKACYWTSVQQLFQNRKFLGKQSLLKLHTTCKFIDWYSDIDVCLWMFLSFTEKFFCIIPQETASKFNHLCLFYRYYCGTCTELILVRVNPHSAEYGEIRSISPNSVRIRENTDQKYLRIWSLFTHSCSSELAELVALPYSFRRFTLFSDWFHNFFFQHF